MEAADDDCHEHQISENGHPGQRRIPGDDGCQQQRGMVLPLEGAWFPARHLPELACLPRNSENLKAPEKQPAFPPFPQAKAGRSCPAPYPHQRCQSSSCGSVGVLSPRHEFEGPEEARASLRADFRFSRPHQLSTDQASIENRSNLSYVSSMKRNLVNRIPHGASPVLALLPLGTLLAVAMFAAAPQPSPMLSPV